jgi:hypothetical protein
MFIKHLITRPWSPVQVKQWSKHDSKKPRDQNREDEKLWGPKQKSAKSCGIRSFIQFEEKLTTRAHMQKGEGSRRLRNRHQAKQVVAGRSGPRPAGPAHFKVKSTPLWPSRHSEPRINSFVIGHRGAEKRGIPSRRGEGRASWLGSP